MKKIIPEPVRTQFSSLLEHLANKIIIMVENYRENLIVEDEVILSVDKIDYLNQYYDLDVDHPQIIKTYYWDLSKVMEFHNTIMETTEFKYVINLVVDKILLERITNPEMAKKINGAFLDGFSTFIINKVINNQVLKLNEIIETYIRDYEREDELVMHNGELWFKNLFLNEEQITINENIVIRRTAKENFPERLRLDVFNSLMKKKLGITLKGKFLEETAIISFPLKIDLFRKEGGIPNEMIEEQNKWELLLSLYKISSPFVTSFRYTPESIIHPTFEFTNPNPGEAFSLNKVSYKNITGLRFHLKSNETNTFINFINIIYPKLKGLNTDSALVGNALEIAENKYLEALQKEKISAYRILTSITGLEALFSEGSGEINYKIKMRIACLFDLLNFQSHSIKKYIRDAYEIRSSIIHGSGFHTKEKEKLLEMSQKEFHTILEILRISCIIYILLDYKKPALIQKLDDAMIDSKIRIKFKDELNELLTKYPIIKSEFLH